MNGEAGKGDAYRPVDWTKWEENYERIFGRAKKKREADKEDEEYVEGEAEDGC
jgi:hypothetical protein